MTVAVDVPSQPRRRIAGTVEWLVHHPSFAAGCAVFGTIVLVSIFAPLIATHDPLAIQPASRLQPASHAWRFGSDPFGRDVFSRVIWGGRISLMVGFGVALLATIVGLFIGLVAGFNRMADAILMRIMDGVMAIPGILLAIALVAVTRPSVVTIVTAIAVPEIPRVVRLVRSIVLSVREQPYVDAARSIGTRFPQLLVRHVLPNTIAPLIVQASFICASAILAEAYLSFLGLGLPPTIPTWGSIIAEGRNVFQLAFWVILYPSLFLGVTVLAVNLIGDGLRDLLDPSQRRRV